MIKTAIIASLAAVALCAPEADPQLLLGGLGYAGHLGYAGLPLAAAHAVPHVPVVKGVVETPAEVATEVTAHAVPVAVGYHGLGYGYGGHYIGKRSADADPAILAGATRIISAPTPLIHNPPVRAIAPVVAHAPLGYGYGLGHLGYGLPAAHVIGKREAEADPQLIAGLPYAGLVHGYAGLPLAAAHAVPHVPVVKGVVETPAEVATAVTAHAVPVAVGYHGLGYGGYGYLG
eukprot:TRINITY_DN827_c0_g1_i12.p1 TRINITY_DN827_c0_g1~~TRINITY_DN827_c0_g1_i12.p1  ORF type:complete len:232 (-),score=88.81 TRINITY_DN827_c0_g1_i12:121-816(-)